MDYNFNWVGVRAVLSNNNVGFASDSSDLQSALAASLCYAPYANQRTNEVPWGISCDYVTNDRQFDELGAIMNRNLWVDSIDVVQKEGAK